MITKLDILLDYNELISTVDSAVKTYIISDLSGDENLSYQSFINLVNSKTPEKYNQVFITETDVKRYVLLLVESLEVKSMQEVLYDNLTVEEKSTFDVFYTVFTK
jgi:type III secretory pathway component EscV